MDRFCPACGTERAEGSSFCGKCGHAFDPAAPAVDPPAAPTPEPSAPAAAAVPPPLPEATPPPVPQPAPAYAPSAGQPAWAPPPGPPPGQTKIPRIVFIIIGVIAIGFGVWKILDAFHVFSGASHSSYSGSASGTGSTVHGIDELWLQGTWTPDSGTRCATWVRFNPDHTLTDEHGNAGTWSLYAVGTTTGDLTMTLGGRPPIHNNASRLEQDLLSVGRRYWRRASC
jgi:hypothetical protein